MAAFAENVYGSVAFLAFVRWGVFLGSVSPDISVFGRLQSVRRWQKQPISWNALNQKRAIKVVFKLIYTLYI